MPELPEVETIVRGLSGPLAGRTIVETEVLRPDLLRESPEAFRRALAGRMVERLARRGKNIVAALNGNEVLVVNLGMTGRLTLKAPEASHPGVRFELDDGSLLVYDDVRRFGVLERLSAAEWRKRSRALGPEPLAAGFSAGRLEAVLKGSRSPVRSLLLDQRKVAGVGNIYANEALHRAGIHPARRAHSLSGEEARALRDSLRAVLRSAIRLRGTTLRDYRDAQGASGSFSAALRVYGRSGLPCERCGGKIERVVFSNRSAFYCPACQPLSDSPRR